MRINILRTVDVDGVRVPRKQVQAILIALTLEDGKAISRGALETLINPADNRKNSNREVDSAISRLRRLLGSALVGDRGGSVSLALPRHSTDLDQFERGADPVAISKVTSASNRIAILRDALDLCPADVWSHLHEYIDGDPIRLGPARSNLLRQRRALAAMLVVEYLRKGEIAAARFVTTEAASDDEWAYDPIAQLALVHALWAGGDRVAAKVQLAPVERFYEINNLDPGFDIAALRARIRGAAPWSVDELAQTPLDWWGRAATPDISQARKPGASRTLPELVDSEGDEAEQTVRQNHDGPKASDDASDSPTTSSTALYGESALAAQQGGATAEGRPDARARNGVVWRGRPRPPRRTVGRSLDLHHVLASMRSASSRTVNPFVVKGPRGIGRSTFLDTLEQTLCGMGWSVASTRCVANYSQPLGVVLDLLHMIDPAPIDTLEGDASDPRHVVEVANAMLRLAAHSPCGLIIDDAHLADPASLAAIEIALAKRTPGHPLWIVLGTGGDPELAVEPEVATALGSIEADRRCEHVLLQPFRDRDVAAVAADMTGLSLDVADCWALADITGGRPAAIVRSIFDLAEADMIWIDGKECFLADHALAHLRQRSEVPLNASDAQLIEILGLLGAEARVADVASILNRPIDRVLDQLSAIANCVVFGPTNEPRVRFNVDKFGRHGDPAHAERTQDRILDAVAALAHDRAAIVEPDPETDAIIARLCGTLDEDEFVQMLGHSVQGLSTARLVAGHLQRHARKAESAGGWVGAARMWDTVGRLADDHQAALAASAMAGRCWLRGHQGEAAADRLRRALDSDDQSVRGSATIDLCRTYSSLLIGSVSADTVIGLVERWREEHRVRPSPVSADVLAEVAGIAAERLAVDRQYGQARVWVANAHSWMRPSCPNLTKGMIAFSAGVVEILAADNAVALNHFNAALTFADGDGWLIAWCSARILLCRSVVQPMDVRPDEVVQAKSLALGVLSWSDVLMADVAAAQIALHQGDIAWAQAEVDEAIQTEARASYELTAQAVRLLYAAANHGALHAASAAWLPGIPLAWARSCASGQFISGADSLVPDWSLLPDSSLLPDIVSALDGVDRDLAAGQLDVWSVATAAIAADLLDRFWIELQGAGESTPDLGALAERAHAHVLALHSGGAYSVLGVPIPLHELVGRLRSRLRH